MEFKNFIAGGVAYGKPSPAPFEYPPGVTNVNFEDENIWEHLDDVNHPQY